MAITDLNRTSDFLFLPSVNPSTHHSGRQYPIMKKSIFGTVKDKLTRKPTGGSDRSKSIKVENDESPSYTGPSSAQVEPLADQLRRLPQRANLPDSRASLNPFASRSTPTRRPEAPPAYSEVAPTASASSRARHAFIAGTVPDDDEYAFLSVFDTVFLIDDSASMWGTRWEEVKQALRLIAPICAAYDSDGIEVNFLNHKPGPGVWNRTKSGGYGGITSTDEVERLFNMAQPRGFTPTGQRVRDIWKPYVALLEEAKANGDIDSVKPMNIIVFTDGDPSDNLVKEVENIAKKLDTLEATSHQLGIQFFQVGNELKARKALRFLDKKLTKKEENKNMRDIVDTCTFNKKTGRTPSLTPEAVLKACLGGVNKTVDDESLDEGNESD